MTETVTLPVCVICCERPADPKSEGRCMVCWRHEIDRLMPAMDKVYGKWGQGLVGADSYKLVEDARRNEKPDVNLADRRIDLAAAVRDADLAIPWRLDRFAADGFVTVLAGKG